MKKYTVHIGCRLTYDVEVIAKNQDEAFEKAENIWRNGDIDYTDMDYADDDFDIIDEEEV